MIPRLNIQCLYTNLKFFTLLLNTMFFIIVVGSKVHANILDFESTRLKSTAGAGVASILIDEATLLNPAPLGLFNVSSIYIQKSSVKSHTQNNDGSRNKHSNDNLGLIISDSKSVVKGSVSYAKTEFLEDKRTRLATSFASPLGKQSAMGVSYRFTTDKSIVTGTEKRHKYQQVVFGFIQAVTQDFTIGLVAIDPFKKNREDTRGIIGIQYVFSDMLALMADASADYNNNFSETAGWNLALQIKVLKDFFVRAGIFDDKAQKTKGSGVGGSWVGPKLSLDFALKNIKPHDLGISHYGNLRDIKETHFSLSFRW